MKLKNMTGYMLGNPNNARCVGDTWTDADCRVWVCDGFWRNRSACVGWNLIVYGQRYIKCQQKILFVKKTHDGLWYTNMPTKIMVERVVYHKDVRQITDADLIVNARRQHGRFAQLMLSLERESVR